MRMSCNNDCNSTNETYDCVSELKSLLQAYIDLSKGVSRKRVESSDGSRGAVVEYTKGDLPTIANLYNQLYPVCGHLSPELPSFIRHTPINTVQRGVAIRGRWY
jgi:hypothetical protein